MALQLRAPVLTRRPEVKQRRGQFCWAGATNQKALVQGPWGGGASGALSPWKLLLGSRIFSLVLANSFAKL